MKRIGVLGAGAFGFAVAKLISENLKDSEISLYDINEEYIRHMLETREHPVFHRGIRLLPNVRPTTDIVKAVSGRSLLVMAIPSKFLRQGVRDFRPHVNCDIVVLNLAKGLEIGTNMMPFDIINAELAGIPHRYEICVLSGGMIASEVTLENPICAELACKDRNEAKAIAKLLWSDSFRIETTDDIIGVSLAGALKNVIAIGAGIFDGLGYGESSKSAFVSSCSKEMIGLVAALGAKKRTFGPGGQAWFGDLMTTCFGKSRNRELGALIGAGHSVPEAVSMMEKQKKSVEGFITTEVVHSLLKKHGIKAPLLNDIHNVLYKDKMPKEFVEHFIKEW